VFEELPLENVETFIASGNVLFDTTARDIGALERKIEKHLEVKLGIEVGTYLRALDDLSGVASNHPFGDAKSRDTRCRLASSRSRSPTTCSRS
jgi:uncharacterized protein (DUF1697 family)